MTARWEHFEHGADIGVRGFGASVADGLRAGGARADGGRSPIPASVRPLERVAVRCEAPDDELLLAEWLNALVYEMATRRMLFSRFAVRLERARPRRARPGASRSTWRATIRRSR